MDKERNISMIDLQQVIQKRISEEFAPEDEGLRNALALAQAAGLPDIQISPIQGRFLQFLATACNARNILEIGSLAGYSGIWLARALPVNGRLITLEANPLHVEITRSAFAGAGVGDRTEVREGKALDLLPHLVQVAPFDLVFIDANKPNAPHYLDWALRLSRPGTIIIADNSIPGGTRLRFPEPGSDEAIAEYNRRLVSDPSLVSIALPLDESYTDGFAMAVVRKVA
jgi:caffeoyl-CoA O-methyltransferase